jgi:hypothetical protein
MGQENGLPKYRDFVLFVLVAFFLQKKTSTKMRSELQHEDGDDGTFYMNYNDWM